MLLGKQGGGQYRQQRTEGMAAAEDWAGGWAEVAKEAVVKEGAATEVGAKAAEAMEGAAMEGAAMEAVAMEAEGCLAQGCFSETRVSTIACHRGEHHNYKGTKRH